MMGMEQEQEQEQEQNLHCGMSSLSGAGQVPSFGAEIPHVAASGGIQMWQGPRAESRWLWA